jgi:hypothetical protein
METKETTNKDEMIKSMKVWIKTSTIEEFAKLCKVAEIPISISWGFLSTQFKSLQCEVNYVQLLMDVIRHPVAKNITPERQKELFNSIFDDI